MVVDLILGKKKRITNNIMANGKKRKVTKTSLGKGHKQKEVVNYKKGTYKLKTKENRAVAKQTKSPRKVVEKGTITYSPTNAPDQLGNQLRGGRYDVDITSRKESPYKMYGKTSSPLEGGSPLAKYGCSKKHSPLKKKKVKTKSSSRSGSYPYTVEGKTSTVRIADRKGDIKTTKQKYTEGTVGEKPSYKQKSKTTHVKGADRMLSKAGRLEIGAKYGQAGQVTKTTTKSADGKKKTYSVKTVDEQGRSFNKKISKKEYKQYKRTAKRGNVK